MTLGERCDEIVRIIDETLGSCAPIRPVARLPKDRRFGDAEEEPLPRNAA